MPRRPKLPREHHEFPRDFPWRLEQLKEASGLTWSELARRLGTNALTLRRWRKGACPNGLHLLALQGLAESLGLTHLLPVVRQRHVGS